jgi:hypothetical protein
MLSIRGVIKRFSLHGFLDQLADSCSHGMRRQLVLAAESTIIALTADQGSEAFGAAGARCRP